MEDLKALTGCAECTWDYIDRLRMALAAACKERDELKKRLAAYEDTGLEPENVRRLQQDWTSLIMTLDEMGGMPNLHELVQAEKDGRLVVLPCKVGNTVYAAETSPVIPLSVAYVGVYLDGADGGDWEALENIGKTVFLTREEAEAVLAQEGGKNE